MAKIRRLYLSGPVSKGVAESQMINWATLLAEHDIFTDFLVFYHKGNTDKFMNMFKGFNDYSLVKGKRYINIFLLREITFLFNILKHLIAKRRKSDAIIIQTRSTSSATVVWIAKLILKTKIVYEIRGAGEEGEIQSGYRYSLNRFNERFMLKKADKVFAVSNKLIEHKEKKFKFSLPAYKKLVVYGAADSNIFYKNEVIRFEKRDQLKISEKVVLLYVGMLDKPWQVPDCIFQLVTGLKKKNPNLFFMAITPNRGIALEYCNKYNYPIDSILIEEASQKELNQYINAADFGLLLRENILVNNVAAPTKFAEYIVGGLPVIISEGIGDYSEMTRANNLGILLKNNEIDFEVLSRQIAGGVQFNRQEIKNFGTRVLSKQTFLKSMIDSYQSL